MSEDEKAIAQVFDEYSGGLNAGDVDRWMSIWDDDGIQMPPHDPVFSGLEQIRKRNTQYFEIYHWSMTMDIKEIQVVGDWAYGRGFYTATLTPKVPGDEVFIDGKFLTILKRQADGSWKIYRDCFNDNVP